MTKRLDFTFSLDATGVQAEPRIYKLSAPENQLVEFAERFKLVALHELTATVSVSNDTKNKIIWLRGDITADLVQQCVVSLGDVPEKISDTFELMLVSPERADELDQDEVYLDPQSPDYDAFEGDVLAVGDMVAQTLSVLMDPYPKKPGAEIKVPNGQGVSVNEELEEKPNPFAVLSKLRDKS